MTTAAQFEAMRFRPNPFGVIRVSVPDGQPRNRLVLGSNPRGPHTTECQLRAALACCPPTTNTALCADQAEVSVGESSGAAFGGFAEVAELAGAHHPLDRRAGLQVAGERHGLGRVVPTEGVGQGVDQRVDGGGVGVGVVVDDP